MPLSTTKERFDAANEAKQWGEAQRPDPTADFGATSPLPPRLRDWQIVRHSFTADPPWAEFSTPDGTVRVHQGDTIPGTNYAFTLLGSEADKRGIPQLQAEVTSGVGERFLIGEGSPAEAPAEAPVGDTVSDFKRAIPSSQLREDAVRRRSMDPALFDRWNQLATESLKHWLNTQMSPTQSKIGKRIQHGAPPLDPDAEPSDTATHTGWARRPYKPVEDDDTGDTGL